MLCNVGFNGADQLRYSGKYAPAQALTGQVAEEAFNHIEPGGGGGREMDVEAGVFLQPLLDLGMLVGGVIVTDQMQGFIFRRFPVDLAR